MSIKITKISNNITENSTPNIKISKVESNKEILHDEDSIITPLYGKIKVVNSIDPEEYTYFDTIKGYNLFINNNADDTVAIKEECLKEDVDSDDNPVTILITNLVEKYNLDLNMVNWSDADNAIIIKSDDRKILNDIYNDYINNKEYEPEFVTEDVLFLNKTGDIKLEDNTDDLIDKLDDGAVKNIASKTGVKLSGTETKDQLKGIIKGAIATQNK
nr:MAG TPA: hypothetical protein [Caudoviricetes sp.]